jgi:preprotein translocase subunit SecA
MLDIIPFDDTSIKRIKGELTKIDSKEEVKKLLDKVLEDVHATREKQLGADVMRQVEKYAYLGSIDHLWIDHIDHIDDLREGIQLRAYGQRDPLVEFKNEAYNLFEGLMDKFDEELSNRLFRINVGTPRVEIPLDQARENIDKSDQTGLTESPPSEGSTKTVSQKLGRNDPCWCNSGKKWKKCHYPQLPN